eukprot:5626960-Amphidinium_carterae.2
MFSVWLRRRYMYISRDVHDACKIGSAECRLYAVSGEPDVLVDLIALSERHALARADCSECLIADDEAKAFYSTEALHGALAKS